MPRRLAITGPHQLEILEYSDPPLAAGQVRVRTEFASGKHGTNLGMFDGRSFAGKVFDQSMRLFVDAETPAQESTPPRNSGTVSTPPRNSGTTGIGIIEAVGPDVEQWQPGDRVFGPMDIRETNICRAGRLWKLGDVPPALALCIEPAYVAFHAVREAQVRFGDTVAVIGLGVLGLLAVRMARLSGAARIVAVDMHDNRLDLARACGADITLHAQRDIPAYDVAPYDVAVEIHRATDGAGVDVAIELAGSYPALQTAIRAARVGGTVCAAGFYQGDAQGVWLGREWHHNRLNMIVPHGCGWGHPPRDFPRWDEDRAYATLAGMMQAGKLTTPDLITPWVDFDAATHIFEQVAQHPETSIKFGVRFPAR